MEFGGTALRKRNLRSRLGFICKVSLSVLFFHCRENASLQSSEHYLPLLSKGAARPHERNSLSTFKQYLIQVM